MAKVSFLLTAIEQITYKNKLAHKLIIFLTLTCNLKK